MNKTDLLEIILKCGSLDLNFFERKFNEWEDLGLKLENIVSEARYLYDDKLTMEILIYVLYNEIKSLAFNKIRDNIENLKNDNKDRINSYLEELENDFNPYINYLDSWFNNFLDNSSPETLIIDFYRDMIENDR